MSKAKPAYKLQLDSRSSDPSGGGRLLRPDQAASTISDSSQRRERRKKAADLIQRWLDDESDHDERFWPILKEELEDSRQRCRG